MQAEEDSKAVVCEYVEAFNRGDLQRLRELLADDAEIQGVKGKGTFEKVEPVWPSAHRRLWSTTENRRFDRRRKHCSRKISGIRDLPGTGIWQSNLRAGRMNLSQWSGLKSKAAGLNVAGAPGTPQHNRGNLGLRLLSNG